VSVRLEDEQLAEQVVVKSKREAHVDTGRLRRSINQKVQRGVIVFREYYYGEYNDNSTLEKNAREMMGSVPYKIERFDEEGDIVQSVNKAQSGRVQRYERKVKRENQARLLAIKGRKKRDEEEDTDKDNRRGTD
jgi:hypothetical protein